MTKMICCFPGVRKSEFIFLNLDFLGANVLDAATADYAQNAFDMYKSELSEDELLSSFVKAIDEDYHSGRYDIIFLPIMQSFVARLEERYPITIITIHRNDSYRIIYSASSFANPDLAKLYTECNLILKTLQNHRNVEIIELPEGDHRIPETIIRKEN